MGIDWYELGRSLEARAPALAAEAYRRAIEADPGCAAARVNLGRLLHEAGAPEVAAEQYRRALAAQPENAVAAFNLGAALEDLGRWEEAVCAYERSRCADAHWNLALLHERRGDRGAALRHLLRYRELSGEAAARATRHRAG